ncbi:MAG TPA: VCBS repeat-containing protein [Myxococcota bacterium]|nr:VCBS repeat-containing protein [Myxococcota bacterium]
MTVSGAVFDIATLHVVVTAQSSGRVEVTDFAPPQGQATIALPVTFTLLLQATRAHARDGALSGPFEVCVTARDDATNDLASGCDVQLVAPDALTDFLVALASPGTDSGVDGGPDGGTCGNGVREGVEACDGGDLGGNDCASIGMGFPGGVLTCNTACGLDTSECADPGHPDFNGDGYADLVVGAYTASGTGRAYVYFGGPGGLFDPTPDGTLAGETAGDYFGYAVAPAGDVNGDGYDDIVVGAGSNDTGGTDAGRAYVYLGGPGGTFDPAPDGALSGETAGDQFGLSVASAGDVNGDGYDDLVVGARFNDAGGTDAGRAYVYLGGPGGTFEPSADSTLTGEAAGDAFGSSVAPAGDVNGDGYDDLAVGAYLNDVAAADAGRAYVYLGNASATFGPVPSGTLTGEVAGDRFGFSVAPAGDVNGDGYDDLVVGAYFNDAGGTSAGRAYVYFGGPAATFDSVPDGTLTGQAPTDQLGISVAPAGDVNRDGYDDVVVGAYLNDAGGTDAGRAYVYLGGAGASFDPTPDGTLTGAAAGDNFGRSVSSAGDVNGDGYDDLTVGAYLNDAGGQDAGRTYLYFGGPTAAFDPVPDGTLTGEAAGDRFGYSVASVGGMTGPSGVTAGILFCNAIALFETRALTARIQ